MEPTSWIAARYEATSLPDEMLLGDGSMPGSGDYFNRPLLNYVPYRVFLRAITVTNVRQTLSLTLSVCLSLPPLSLSLSVSSLDIRRDLHWLPVSQPPH